MRTTRPHLVGLERLSALAAVMALTACGPSAPTTSPTAQTAATQVAKSSPAATVGAAASPVAAAASPATSPVAAAASPVATQIAAAASPVATQAAAAASPVATQAAAAAAASPVRITGGQLSPTDTTITIQNAGTQAVDMSGWRMRVGTVTAALPANTRLGPTETLTVHTASGTSTGRDVYLGQEAAALLGALQPGAGVALLDAQGNVVSEFTLPRL
jgi:lamin tail-like protein